MIDSNTSSGSAPYFADSSANNPIPVVRYFNCDFILGSGIIFNNTFRLITSLSNTDILPIGSFKYLPLASITPSLNASVSSNEVVIALTNL